MWAFELASLKVMKSEILTDEYSVLDSVDLLLETDRLERVSEMKLLTMYYSWVQGMAKR